MKILVLKDKLITNGKFLTLQKQVSDLYALNAYITPQFFIEDRDYTDYPTTIDSDGDERIDQAYIKRTTDDIDKRYSGEGTDHVVFLIHEDNWKSDPDGPGGIWGTNYSFQGNNYLVQYVRYDKDNLANSIGTFYHEIHHSHDATIRKYLGVQIEKILGVDDYDRDITHGKGEEWTYIRYKENLESLRIMAPYLKLAYTKRDEIYQKKVLGLQTTVIGLLEQLIILYRGILKKRKY